MQILAQRGTGSELVAATTNHFDVAVFGVDFKFHIRLCQNSVLAAPYEAGSKSANTNRFYQNTES